MTTRNLNRTWFDVLKAQYKADYDAGVPYPIKYLLFNPKWKADLFYEVAERIEPDEFRRAVVRFNRSTKVTGRPEFADGSLKVWARKGWVVAASASEASAAGNELVNDEADVDEDAAAS